jgi:phage-related protein (TIGR01555 family)
MAARICGREAEDAMRAPPEVRGTVRGVPLENDPEAQKRWASAFRKLDVHGATVRGRTGAKASGGALWVLWVEDGRRTDQPIDWLGIKGVSWIRVVRGGSDGRAQPLEYETDPWSPRYGQPRLYNVSFADGRPGIFHWHRVIAWQGIVIDDETLVDNNGWGESTLDRVWSAVRNFGAAHQYASLALQKLSQGVFKSQYLADALASGRQEQARRRLEDVSLGMGATGEIGIGPQEDYTIVGRPVSGVDALMREFANALVAATDMPEIVLMGRRPGGLSTSADGEFRGWYDYVSSQQPIHYTPPLVRLIEILSRAADGPTGGVPVIDPDIYWPPLWQLTDAEKLDNRLKAAQARALDSQNNHVSIDEVRTDPDLDEWYQLGTLTAPPEDEALQRGEVEAAPPELIPAGEQLISIREAADILGYKSSKAARNFASQHGAVFRVGAGYKVARSLLMAGLRASQVEAPAPAQPEVA